MVKAREVPGWQWRAFMAGQNHPGCRGIKKGRGKMVVITGSVAGGGGRKGCSWSGEPLWPEIPEPGVRYG